MWSVLHQCTQNKYTLTKCERATYSHDWSVFLCHPRTLVTNLIRNFVVVSFSASSFSFHLAWLLCRFKHNIFRISFACISDDIYFFLISRFTQPRYIDFHHVDTPLGWILLRSLKTCVLKQKNHFVKLWIVTKLIALNAK